MRTSRRNNAGAAVLLFLLLPFPAAVLGATGPNLTPFEANQIRSFAAAALEQVAQARRDAESHRLPQAARGLTTAGILLNMAAASRPTGATQSLLHYLRLELNDKDNQQALPDLLPAYGALDVLDNSLAAQAARSHLDAVKRALEDGNRAAALTALAKTEKDLSIDVVDLPLDAARDSLRRLLAPEDGKPAFTDSELQALEEDVLSIIEGAAGFVSLGVKD